MMDLHSIWTFIHIMLLVYWLGADLGVLMLALGSKNSNYSFVKAFCYSIAGFVFVHFFINIGMTMGISPVIGIPLPFISKGGSSLMAFSIMIGVVLNMSKER